MSFASENIDKRMAEVVESASDDAAASGGARSAFGVPAFRALWFNSITFYLAANALRFVYGWVVLDGLGKGEDWQGFVVFILGVPSFFLLIPAGVWADRIDPKKMLIATQVTMLAVMVITAVALGDGSGSVTLLICSALGAGAATAMGGPVRSALIPSLLRGDLLYGGIALNAIAITLSLVLGAVTARIFGDWFGFDGAFYYMAALLVVGLLALTRLVSPGPASTGDKATMRQAMGDGWKFAWNERGIRTLFLLLAISGFVMSPLMMVTSQAHIKDELGRDASDAAPLLALMGVGIAISSVYILRRGNMANKSIAFMRAMVIGCSILTLMGRTTQYWQILVLGLVLGICGGFFINMNQGLIQANTPSELMGRVMSLYSLVQTGMLPVGALLFGLIASKIGTGDTMSLGGIAGLLSVVMIYVKGRSIREIN